MPSMALVVAEILSGLVCLAGGIVLAAVAVGAGRPPRRRDLRAPPRLCVRCGAYGHRYFDCSKGFPDME